jgi:hypothetical protein
LATSLPYVGLAVPDLLHMAGRRAKRRDRCELRPAQSTAPQQGIRRRTNRRDVNCTVTDMLHLAIHAFANAACLYSCTDSQRV